MQRSIHRRHSVWLLIILFMLSCPSEISAQRGRGGFKANPRGRGHATVPGPLGTDLSRRAGTRPATPPGGRSRAHEFASPGFDRQPGNDAPWNDHVRREQRKLDHRRRVAEHLREISERNGNPQLLQVADDMERRAFSHYDQKLQQLGNQHPVDGNPVNDPAVLPQPRGTGQAHSALQPDSLRDEFVGERGEAAADRLTGRDNALYRQLQNEQRQLDRRLEAARRMREVAADTADPRLLDAANQMEDLALTRFDERMSRILDFQERHSLPDVSPDP